MPTFYEDTGNPNSGPHVLYMASILVSGLSSQP